jgi:hypothetical protein
VICSEAVPRRQTRRRGTGYFVVIATMNQGVCVDA